jgi:hypothetical protein
MEITKDNFNELQEFIIKDIQQVKNFFKKEILIKKIKKL